MCNFVHDSIRELPANVCPLLDILRRDPQHQNLRVISCSAFRTMHRRNQWIIYQIYIFDLSGLT